MNLAVKKGIGGEQRCQQGFHAPSVVLVGEVGLLENWGIVDGLVTSHPVTENMANENLLDAFTPGQFLNHVNGIGNRPIYSGITAEKNFATGIDWFSLFLFTKDAELIIHFERQAERIHFRGTRMR